MNLKERLVEDMKAAMKAGEPGKLRLSVIRMVRSAVKNAEIDKMRELNDDEVAEVIARELKLRRDAIPDYERGGRQDLVQQAHDEIAILSGYLPQQLSAEEIRSIAQEVIQSAGAAGPRDMGKVMQAVMPRVRGRADGKLVNQVVRELLGG